MREGLGRLLDYEGESAPFKEGGYAYFYRNAGLQNQSVIFRTDRSGVKRVFLDLNTLSPAGTTSVSSLSFSPSGKLAAYQKSEGGADWRSVEVLNAETLSVIHRIDDVKFSRIAWRGKAPFNYSR